MRAEGKSISAIGLPYPKYGPYEWPETIPGHSSRTYRHCNRYTKLPDALPSHLQDAAHQEHAETFLYTFIQHHWKA